MPITKISILPTGAFIAGNYLTKIMVPGMVLSWLLQVFVK